MTAAPCGPTRTRLSRDEAHAVLEPYFLVVRERFAPKLPKTAKVTLEVAGDVHDTERHFAGWDGHHVVAAAEMAELPEGTVLAIFSHEFGHATDFLYPGAYVFVDGEGLVTMPRAPEDTRDLDKRGAQALRARMRWWQDRDDDAIERTADAIAEHIIGKPIGYAGPCMLQSFGGGERPRPRGLR